VKEFNWPLKIIEPNGLEPLDPNPKSHKSGFLLLRVIWPKSRTFFGLHLSIERPKIYPA
jgi:hypothetical protein